MIPLPSFSEGQGAKNKVGWCRPGRPVARNGKIYACLLRFIYLEYLSKFFSEDEGGWSATGPPYHLKRNAGPEPFFFLQAIEFYGSKLFHSPEKIILLK